MAKRKDEAFRIGYVGFGQKPQTKTPPIVEGKDWHLDDWMKRGLMEPGTKFYRMGQCTIYASPPAREGMGWHLSMAHPVRYPTWDEIAKARYELLPNDRDFVMVLPKPEDYLSVHENCFHLWEDGKERG